MMYLCVLALIGFSHFHNLVHSFLLCSFSSFIFTLNHLNLPIIYFLFSIFFTFSSFFSLSIFFICSFSSICYFSSSYSIHFLLSIISRSSLQWNIVYLFCFSFHATFFSGDILSSSNSYLNFSIYLFCQLLPKTWSKKQVVYNSKMHNCLGLQKVKVSLGG